MFILEVSYGCPSEKYSTNGNFQFDQAKALKEYGHDIIFIALDMRSIRRCRKMGFFEHKKDDIPVFEYNFPLGPIFPDLKLLIQREAFAIILKKIIKKYKKPDLVHVHFGETAMAISPICVKENIPYVITEHSSALNLESSESKYIKKLRKVYVQSKAIVAVSSSLSKRIEELLGIDTIVIPNIVDFSTFNICNERHDGFKIVTAGYLNYGKGFDITIRALKQMIDQGFDSHLVIMGDGAERTNLEQMALSLGLKDCVTFWGKYTRKEFNEVLGDSDVFVLASRGETFGVVYTEAISTGTPVVATRCGGPEEFVNDRNGILVDIEDVQGIADGLKAIFEHKYNYDKELMRDEVLNRFSSREVSERLTKVFESILMVE